MNKLTVEANVVERNDSWLAAVTLNGYQDGALLSHDLLLGGVGVIPGEGACSWELKLDVLQLNVVHAVAGHSAGTRADKINMEFLGTIFGQQHLIM